MLRRLFRFASLLAVVAVAIAAVGTGCSTEDDGAEGGPAAAATAGEAEAPAEPPTAGSGSIVELTDEPMSAADEATVDEAVQGAMGNAFGPAVHVGIWDPDKGFLMKAYGEAEQGSVPATVDDTFRIGSITKTFTATVILLLVDGGALALGDTIEDAAPEIAAKYPEVADRTVEQLLGMTSGITDYFNVPDGLAKQITEHPETEFSADDLISAGIAGGVAAAGTEGYSTTNYILLQEIAEEVTGESLPDLVQSRVAEPLGLTGTALPTTGTEGMPEPFTHGYLNEDCVDEVVASGGTATAGTDTTDWNVSYGQGGGGMYSTLHDLGVFGASTLGSVLLSDELASRRLEPTADVGGGRTYGLGIFRLGDWLGHSGEALGWEALILHNAETDVTLAFAVNSCAGGEVNFRLIGDQLYPDTGLLDGIL
jgi:D-alanyl-D-alanine carboxypeptidase